MTEPRPTLDLAKRWRLLGVDHDSFGRLLSGPDADSPGRSGSLQVICSQGGHNGESKKHRHHGSHPPHHCVSVAPRGAGILSYVTDTPSCVFCGTPTYDPSKKERPWARGVAEGRQVLVCPRCQVERPDWAADLDVCEECGATRLNLTLGQVVCRACGHMKGA